MAVSTSPTNAERAQSTRLGALCILHSTTTKEFCNAEFVSKRL